MALLFLFILGENQSAGKKKKKNRGKKKSATASAESTSSKTTVCTGQTDPPTVPIVKLFSDGKLPS